MTHDMKYYSREMMSLTPLTKVLKFLRAVRIYADGDTVSLVFRWYHPLYWLIWFFMLPACLWWGVKIAKEGLPIKVSSYFDDKEILWL